MGHIYIKKQKTIDTHNNGMNLKGMLNKRSQFGKVIYYMSPFIGQSQKDRSRIIAKKCQVVKGKRV